MIYENQLICLKFDIIVYEIMKNIEEKRIVPVSLAAVLVSKLSYTDLALSCPLKAIISSKRHNCHDLTFMVHELVDLNLK